jgi:hypothetical protein
MNSLSSIRNKNLIELKLYMNSNKNLIELKLYRNPTKNMIKFLGVGEKVDALEPFHPDRIATPTCSANTSSCLIAAGR